MTQQAAETAVHMLRQERLLRAFFRGGDLNLENPAYQESVRTFLRELLASDIACGDATVAALGLDDRQTTARIFARESGVAAGVSEWCWLLGRDLLQCRVQKQDGEAIEPGDVILEIEGPRREVLARERVGLNLLQRLSGIATATRRFQEIVHRHNPNAHVVGTRKTPWGLLDKRALHLGGGGTHRLGLWDAILIKNNHLALLAEREEEAVRLAIERAWASRETAAFIEVEVRSEGAALAAAETFGALQESEDEDTPCLLLLDNMSPEGISGIVASLDRRGLLDLVLTEASGNVSENNLEHYAASGVDAISVGALTHSPRALDLCQRI